MAAPSSRSATHATMNMGAVVGALSHALDLTEGQPPGHCLRAAHVGRRVGAMLGLTGARLDDLWFAIVLKDLGCSSNAARICELYLADDIAFKRDFKEIDGSLGAALRFVLKRTGVRTEGHAGWSERFRSIVNILQNGGSIAHELIETRCHRGADIAARMRFGADVQDGIRSLDERYDGSGKPCGLAGEAIPLFSRIALAAQVFDIFHTGSGLEAARREIEARAGTWFDPAVARALCEVAAEPGLADALADGHGLVSAAPHADMAADERFLDDVAAAFADVVDAKSPFTSGHCERVTLYADMIAEEMEIAPDRRRWLRRAALLHDIGKLGVGNDILDKPGRPSDREWDVIRTHPVHGRRILRLTEAFADCADIAGDHHEKLDGTGYPNGRTGAAIAFETRIVSVADVFDALSADRPYRKAMPPAKALAILDEGTGTAFDASCVAALKRALDRTALLAA